MKFTFLPLLLLCLLLSGLSHAGVLKGTVRDHKGETLPFASVFVQGSTIGTAANAAGDYTLSLMPGTYQVYCQFIGYKQEIFKVTITGNETVQHSFTLQEQKLEMKEVVVKSKDEDPAYRIIRKAIARRSFHLQQVKAFQSSIYLKGVFRTTQTPDKFMGQKLDKGEMGVDSTGKGVLYLCEEIADYYAQEPNKERTVIHSVRESGDANGLGFAQLPSVITFYENNVRIIDQIAPRGFVSPIADGAIGLYKYKLEGEFVENNRIIYKIKVSPRRKYEPVFDGTIYIVEGDWAIHSLSLTSNEKTGIEYLESLRIDQVFVPLKTDTWVIKNQVFHPMLNVLGFAIAGNFVTVYNNQKVNEPVPDTIFNKKIVSIYDKTANKKDTGYWENQRPIPLETDEVKDYHVKDSMAAVPPDLAKEDSMRRRSNRHIGLMNILVNGKTFTGKQNKQSWSINSVLFFTNYNTVEGLNLAPKLQYRRTLDTGKILDAKVAVRYGFENRHFNAMAGIGYTHNDQEWRGRGWRIGIEGGKYVFQFNPDNPVDPLLNTFSTLLYNQNYLKLYERWDAAITYRYNGGNGLKWDLKLNYQERMPLENVSDYSWAKGNRAPFTDNVPAEIAGYDKPAHHAFLLHAGVSYQPGFTYVQYPDFKSPQSSNWPVFSLSYDKGIPGILDSKTDFDKWRVGIHGNVRLKLLGVITYDVAAGGFLNDAYVGLPDMMHIHGNQMALAAPYLRSFQLAPYYRFSNTEKLYGEAHVEYNLYGLLTNKIPLLRQAKLYFILGNNTFYASNKNYYTEAFVSIDNIGYKLYRLLRLDFVQSWDAEGRRSNGIRLGLRVGGLFSIKTDRGTEW